MRKEHAPIDALAFSPLGEYVMIGNRTPFFEALAAVSGQPIFTAGVQTSDGVREMAFSRNGRIFAVLTQAEEIRVYETSGWKEAAVIEHAGSNGLALSPDGALVASGLFSPEARIWEVRSKKIIRTIRVKGGRRPSVFMDGEQRRRQLWKAVWRVEFSPDKKKLATATDGYIQLWNLETGMELAAVKSGGRAGTLAFSNDGERIGWATWKGELRIWDIDSHRLLQVKIPTILGVVAFSSDFGRAYVPDW
jgi:WD40 repeat protein